MSNNNLPANNVTPQMMAYPVLMPFVPYPQHGIQAPGVPPSASNEIPAAAAAPAAPTVNRDPSLNNEVSSPVRNNDRYLTLSEEFLKTVENRPVREWRTSDALAWLEDLFSGADDLEK